ncbi:hypothetical protein V1511DRAFT_453016, partial [Dipodascopsis uninucleata]
DSMSLAKLAVAKATLAAELLRPPKSGSDPASVSSSTVKNLHAAIDSSISKNTPENVKVLKQLFLENIVLSDSRIAAFGKYITALASTQSRRHAKLYILYDINDILYHTVVRDNSRAFVNAIQYFLPDIMKSALAHTRLKQKLEELMQIWIKNQYFTEEFCNSLLNQSLESKSTDQRKETDSEPPHDESGGSIFPAVLGAPDTPYYDLPVSTMLPHIRGAMPINVAAIKPVPLDAEKLAASKELQEAIESYYRCLEWKPPFVESDEPPSQAEFVYEGWSVDFFEQNQDDD